MSEIFIRSVENFILNEISHKNVLNENYRLLIGGII